MGPGQRSRGAVTRGVRRKGSTGIFPRRRGRVVSDWDGLAGAVGPTPPSQCQRRKREGERTATGNGHRRAPRQPHGGWASRGPRRINGARPWENAAPHVPNRCCAVVHGCKAFRPLPSQTDQVTYFKKKKTDLTKFRSFWRTSSSRGTKGTSSANFRLIIKLKKNTIRQLREPNVHDK